MWAFFQKYQKLNPLPGSHRIFAVVPKVKVQIASTQKYQSIRSNSTPAISHAKFGDIPEAVSQGMIRESLSDMKTITVTERNFNDIFVNSEIKNGYSPSELEIAPSFVIECWKRLLKIESFSDDDFLKLKQQWKNIEENTWKSNSKFRSFVSLSEKYLKQEKFVISGGEEIAFNALISYFVQSMNTACFEAYIVRTASLITNCLLAGKTGENFILQNGEESTQDHCSAIVFTILDSICQKTSKIWDNLFDDTMQLLMLTSPSTNELLTNAGVKNFEFMKQEIGFFFCKDRTQEDSVLMFTAALSSHQIETFTRSLIASCFTLLHNRLVEIVNQGPQFFFKTVLCLIPSINARVLIQDSRVFIDFINDGNM